MMLKHAPFGCKLASLYLSLYTSDFNSQLTVRGIIVQLRLKRAQRSAGLLGNKVMFMLQARLNPTQVEQALIQKYGLGGLVVYNSTERRKHAETAAASTSRARGLAALAMSALSLQCTIGSLMSGQTVECKDLEEMIAAETAITEACHNTKAYLEIATSFDGREVTVDI